MRHLFIVHSSTTEIISKGIVASLDIDKTNVVFITDRTYQMRCSASSIFELPSSKFTSSASVLKNRRLVKQLDLFIDGVIGNEQYSVYLPHIYDYRLFLIASNSKCISYNFIEEGMLSYYSLEEANNLHRRNDGYIKKVVRNVLTRFSFGKRLRQEDKIFNEGYSAVFGFYDESFPGFRPKVLIDFQTKNATIKFEIILIIGAEVEVGQIEISEYLLVFEKLMKVISDLKLNNLIFGIKFHPIQSDKVKSAIKSLCVSYGVDNVEIDANQKIEGFYNKAVHQLFIQTNSSVGFYASKSGAKVISLSKLSERLEAQCDELPSCYHVDILHPKDEVALKSELLEFQLELAI